MVGATDVGLLRKYNQDSLYFNSDLGVGVVADGIGGRKGGEVASKLAVNGLKNELLNSEMIRHDEAKNFLLATIDRLNATIIDEGFKKPHVRGMGTTLECIMFVGEKAYLAHVGDSRTYLYYHENLFQLTIDHNVETFLEKGWMQTENILPGSKKSALTRALGLTNKCEVDLYSIDLLPGQVFLTCSDGLYGMIDDRTLLKIMNKYAHNIEQLPKVLINEANKQGGKDNITVLVASVEL